MLLSQTGSLAAGWCSSSRPCSGSPLLPAQQLGSRRSTACHAKRGRPPKNKTTTEDAVADATAELEPAPAKRKGRKPKTEVEPAPTTAEAPLTVQTQPLPVAVSLSSLKQPTTLKTLCLMLAASGRLLQTAAGCCSATLAADVAAASVTGPREGYQHRGHDDVGGTGLHRKPRPHRAFLHTPGAAHTWLACSSGR